MTEDHLKGTSLVFPVKPLFSRLAVIGLTLIGIIILIFLVVILLGGELTGRDLLVLPLLLPLAAILVYFLLGTSGVVMLNEDEIIVQRGRRRRSMRYEEIQVIRGKDLHLPPNLVLIGEGKKLRISRQIQNFPHFYRELTIRVPALRPAEVKFPFHLRIRPGYLFWQSFGFFSLLVLLGGMFVLLVRNAYDYTSYFIACVIPLGLWWIILFLFLQSELMLLQPVRWVFTADEIRVKKIYGPWEVYGAKEIEVISLQERDVQGVPQPAVVMSFPGVVYSINVRRARQFGHEPEVLYLILRDLYGLD